MFKRSLSAAMVAAMLLMPMPGAVWATQNDDNKNNREQRDGHSRYEGKYLDHVPVVLNSRQSMRVLSIIWMMQQLTYITLTNLGVDMVTRDRAGLGGLPLIGGLFHETYDVNDYGEDNAVGSVFFAPGKLVVALKNNLKLEDLKVVILDTKNQYRLQGAPEVNQVPAESLAQLGLVPIFNQMLLHLAAPEAAAALGSWTPAAAESDPNFLQNLGADVLPHLPMMSRHYFGRAYLGPNNTLLIIPQWLKDGEDW